MLVGARIAITVQLEGEEERSWDTNTLSNLATIEESSDDGGLEVNTSKHRVTKKETSSFRKREEAKKNITRRHPLVGKN